MQFTDKCEEQGDCRMQVKSQGDSPALVIALALIVVTILSTGLLLMPTRVSASTSSPTLQINAGFGTYFRIGAWVPLYITLHNNGSDFNGMLTTSNPEGLVWQDTYSMVPSTIYQQPVTVPRGTQKQVTLYLPITTQSATVSIIVQLLDSYGKVVQSQTVLLHQLFSGNAFVGLLSDQMNGFDALRNVVLPNSRGSMQVEYLTAQNMPSMEAVLANFNLIILDSFHTSSLTPEQLRALYLWVQQGGSLIEVGGPNWQQTVSALPANLLPVSIHGVSILPAGTHLLPAGISIPVSSGSTISDTLQVPVPVSSAMVLKGARTIVSVGDVPLLVQEQSGQGLIYYLAYDPALDPIVHWPEATVLWRSLVIRSLAAQLLLNNPPQGLIGGMPFYLAKLQHLLLSNPSPAPWVLLFLFLGYLLILGPIRWLIVHRTKQRRWNWRIILGAIVIFTLLNYAVAFYQERASIFSNSLSLIQLSGGSSVAHSTTYHGIYLPFTPANSTLQVQLPGGFLVQPYVDASQQSERAAITANKEGAQVKESDTNIRFLDAFQAEQDISMQGSINSHLVLSQGMLSGTVTNTLPTALSDVYLLMLHRIVRIGNMAAGQTSSVALSLTASSTNGGQAACGSLVKQVVNGEAGIITQYDHLFVHPVGQSLSAMQRHLSLLAFMLSAAQCNDSSFESEGSSATLIGWADQPLAGENAVTVDDIHPGGLHETAVVAALNLSYATGSLTLPVDVIPGRLVDTEALGAHLLSTDSYAFAHGQMTFEYSLPSLEHFRIQAMTLSQPTDPSILPSEQPGGSYGSSHVALYNWQTNSWEIIRLTQSIPFSTQNAQAYFSPDGRMLVQYVDQAGDFSEIAFTMPSLTVTGVNSLS
ncbi:MAG TPA: hypothetical protein VNW73_11270 [Ktedonobacteraceae bacterium]|nr:hypothetical protein [Ktedonobacteraceae bacterium]